MHVFLRSLPANINGGGYGASAGHGVSGASGTGYSGRGAPTI